MGIQKKKKIFDEKIIRDFITCLRRSNNGSGRTVKWSSIQLMCIAFDQSIAYGEDCDNENTNDYEDDDAKKDEKYAFYRIEIFFKFLVP